MEVRVHFLTPVGTSFLSHKLNKLRVAGIKLDFIINVHPFCFLDIITSFQKKMIYYFTFLCLSPRIIRVPRLIHIALIGHKVFLAE